ncbi:MAG: permease [Planctomycetota bacterium]
MPIIQEFCTAFCAVLLESAPLVVLGFVIAGLLHEFVPDKILRRGVAGRSLAPVARVVGVGALLPICSCSTIPLGVGLTRSGASIGTALAFMTSSPAISPVTVVLGWAVLGPMLLGWYSLVAVVAAVVIGLVGNHWLGEVPEPAKTKSACSCSCGANPPAANKLSKALRWSFDELGTDLSGSLLLGLLAASLILVALPEGIVSGWLAEPSWTAMAAAVAVSLPAYTCSVPSLLIAGSLLTRGVDPGVAVAFLIAGPATNLGELNAIRGAMGSRAAAFYGGSLIAIALAAGSATAWLPEAAVTTPHAHAGHDHGHALEAVVLSGEGQVSLSSTPRWRWLFAGCIAVLAVRSMLRCMTAAHKHGQDTKHKPAAEPAGAPQLYGVATK